MVKAVQLDRLYCPDCHEEQTCSLVVSMFGEAGRCLACYEWNAWRFWQDSAGQELGEEGSRRISTVDSAMTRPAIFVATEGADLFGLWIAGELNRRLYARHITTLHCCDRWFDGWYRQINVHDWRAQVRVAAEHADCVLLVGDLRDLGRQIGQDLERTPEQAMRAKLVIVRNRATGLPARASLYRLFNMAGDAPEELTRIIEEISAAFSGSAIVLPMPPKAILGAIVEPINEQLIREISRRPGLLRDLGWRDVEKLVAEVLAGLGHSVELQRGTKDGGVDIIAFRSGFTTDKLLVQVKHPRTGRFVGVEPVQRLYYVRNEQHATKGIIACTSGFTRGARELLERYRWELEGRDQAGILEWVRDYLQNAR